MNKAMLSLALAAAVALAAPRGKALAGNCDVCHGSEAVGFSDSVHKDHALSCTSCHGGDDTLDPKALTGERRTAACLSHPKFTGRPEATHVTDLCGGCHSDVGKMRPYRIPTDQLTQYRTSYHGKALYEKGDRRTATCISCHGTHEIRRVKDPRSSANRLNVPKTCAACHADQALMGSYGLPSGQLAEYSTSVHGKGLIEGRLPGVPTCADCHGTHGAAPPGATQAAETCGSCHPSARHALEQGPHRKSKDGKSAVGCTDCHGSHAVPRSTREMFTSTAEGGCLSCHEPGDKGGVAAREFRDSLAALELRIAETAEKVLRNKRRGLFLEEDIPTLGEARRLLISIKPETHALRLDDLREIMVRTREMTKEADDLVLRRMKIWRDRRILSVVGASALLGAAGVLYLILLGQRRYRREAAASTAVPGGR